MRRGEKARKRHMQGNRDGAQLNSMFKTTPQLETHWRFTIYQMRFFFSTGTRPPARSHTANKSADLGIRRERLCEPTRAKDNRPRGLVPFTIRVRLRLIPQRSRSQGTAHAFIFQSPGSSSVCKSIWKHMTKCRGTRAFSSRHEAMRVRYA